MATLTVKALANYYRIRLANLPATTLPRPTRDSAHIWIESAPTLKTLNRHRASAGPV